MQRLSSSSAEQSENIQNIPVMQSLQTKQKYLRENILQKGYDPTDFIQYLEITQQIDHVDIEGWSMNQIKHLVGIYTQYKLYSQDKVQQKANKKQQAKNNTDKSDTVSNKAGNGPSAIQSSRIMLQKQTMKQYEQNRSLKIEYPRYAPLFDYEFKAKCKCIQAEDLIKKQGNLDIVVPKFELVESAGFFLGIGSKTQVWFHVQTNINKSSTKRLLQDFDWFSQNLIRLFPILALPQLVEFKNDGQFANQKRRLEIQQYLKYLAKKSLLLKSAFFMDFLTIDQKKIEKFKKSYETVGFAKGVSFLKTNSGQINVQLTKKTRNYQQACFNYSRKVQLIHEAIDNTLSKTIQSFGVVTDNLNRIVDYFADLHQAYNDLMNKHPQHKNRQYNQLLINMNNLFHGVSDNIKNHSMNLEKHLKDYFKFNILTDKNVTRLEKYIKEEEKSYLQYKYSLTRKKQRLIPEPEKWDVDLKLIENLQELKKNKQKLFSVMLPRETCQETELKIWMAFLYTNFQKEFQQYIHEETVRYAERYKLFAMDLLNKDKNYLESLTRFIQESRKIGQ